MKKIIKTVIIIVVLVGLTIGGLYFGYQYKQGKKVAEVALVSNYAWAGGMYNSIESYGEVTSEKSQTAYISAGTEIISLNVSEGSHVNAGDVIMTVKKETQDIEGKELQVLKTKQAYDAIVTKLNRLENTTPIPEYIAYSDDTRTRYDDDGNPYEVVVGRFYYDGETGKWLGHDGYNADGELVEKFEEPKGYKPSELKVAIEETQVELMKADLELRKIVNELEVMKNTDDNGDIKAKVSGTVSKVQNKDNYNSTQPFMIITATDEYYIAGSIGEFYLDSVHVGDTVTINSWETGNTADAVIESISDTPQTDNNSFWSSGGNSNSSNYEFKAIFDRNSGIEIGSFVNINITPSGTEEDTLYIPNYFIKKDSSGSYVMRMNEDKKLEKVYVKIGKSLWGEMIEVKSGVTNDDYLAFPYGNGAIEGIQCIESEYLGDNEGGLG